VHAFVHGALISNSVKDQAFLAQSSCEAELAGQHRGAIMGIFLQNMWEEMFGEKLDIIIETDSSAARCVAMRQGIGRIRHLEVRQIYMQQLVKSERLIVKKLPGVDNTADLGTKAVTAATFYHLIELVGLRKFANDELEVLDSHGAQSELPKGTTTPFRPWWRRWLEHYNYGKGIHSCWRCKRR
jgi:hypothetical protein